MKFPSNLIYDGKSFVEWVPGWYGKHSKCNYLQDRGHFHRSLAWQIVLSFNTAPIIVQLYDVISVTSRPSVNQNKGTESRCVIIVSFNRAKHVTVLRRNGRTHVFLMRSIIILNTLRPEQNGRHFQMQFIQ